LVEDGAARPPWWQALRAIDRVDACRGELSDALRGLQAARPRNFVLHDSELIVRCI
jgi:hypothetical protein